MKNLYNKIGASLVVSVVFIAFQSVTYAKSAKTKEVKSLQPARVFGSHMVLQCDKPIKVWGEAPSGETVKVQLGSEARDTKANAQGEWEVQFPAREASFEPISMQINRLRYTNILIGEVWICSGQSNMALPVRNTDNSEEILAKAENDNLRLLVHNCIRGVARDGYTEAELERCNADDYYTAQWAPSRLGSAQLASAVGWIFGNGLQKEKGVPVGIIQISAGGSDMGNWIPPSIGRKHPLLAPLYEKDWIENPDVFRAHRIRAKDALQNVLVEGEPYMVGKMPYRWSCEPGFLFEAGIAPLKGMSFRGILWYQGESDAINNRIAERANVLFPLMIESWREYLDAGECPFVFVQLPGFNGGSWPMFREAQRNADLNVSNTAMAVTIDLGDKDNIHPGDKQAIGDRVLHLALKHTYGQDNRLGFPVADSAHVNGKDIILKLSDYGKGMLPVEGNIPGFEVGRATGGFRAAVAQQTSPDSITIKSNLPNPARLRYGWQGFPDPSLKLFNSEKLPLGPFQIQID